MDFTGAATSNYSTIKYVIDGLPAKNFMLPLPGGATSLQLATGLSNTNHTLAVYIQNSLQGVDRWDVPQCVFRVVGLTLDDGAMTLPPTLRPKRMIVYWDSIGEGVEVLDFPGTDLTHNEATQTWAYALAAALQAEVSMVAFGRLGWTVYGNGNVPPVFTPGNDTLSSWDKIDSKHPRNFTGQLDYIFIGHGTNDNGSPDAAVEASAFGWLVAQRAAVTSATSIIMVVPFGGFKEFALDEVFTTYQQKYDDKQTYFINLGTPAQEGLTQFVPGGTWESEDGIHPNVWRDGQLGAMLALAVGSTLKL
eukprot:Phypoly_transcript_13941.p1 GENE.Phypoly_transcript_13941~~Phypoly_transcript_13941.p1  ORF type:complete len:314 (+),score=63.58 Phypoly_transcript_13941:27-944(+)